MKKIRCFSLKIILIFSFFQLTLFYGQTITSTTSGGDWGNPAAWVGGIVPTTNNDVIINGTINITGTTSCKSIVVNSGKILQNGGSMGWLYLIVPGNITNNGTIRNNPTGNSLYIVAKSNVTNNGVWTNAGIYMPGENIQYISQGSGNNYETELTAKNESGYSFNSGKIIAASNLVFTKNINLQGYISGVGYTWQILDMANYNLTISSSSVLYNSTIQNVKDMIVLNEARIYNTSFEGNVNLKGRGTIENNDVWFKNDLTVSDTLQNCGGLGWLYVHIEGKLTNNGVIKNNDKANALGVEVWGDIENNGVWKNSWLHLPSKNIQNISQAPGKVFETIVIPKNSQGYTNSTGKLVAKTDLTFSKDLYLQGYISGVGYTWQILDMANKNLTIKGTCALYQSTIQNVNHLTVLEDARIYDSSFEGDVILKGRGKIENSGVTFKDNLVVADTLQNSGGLGWLTVYIQGNLINNGVIKNNDKANSLAVEVWGNIENNGIWRNSWTYLPSKKIQNIKQNQGKFFDTEIFAKSYSGYTDTTGYLIAASDLTFNKNVNLQGYVSGFGYKWTILNMNNYNMTMKGDSRLFEAGISNINDFTILENAAIYNTSFETDVIFKGRGRIDNSNVYFKKSLTVIDTLQNGGGYGWLTPIVYGDIINYGYVKNNKAGNSLELDLRGNVYNYGKWENSWTYLKTEGTNKKITGEFFNQIRLKKTGTPALGDVSVEDVFITNNDLYLDDQIKLIIPSNSEFINNGKLLGDGSVTNNGSFTSKHSLQWNDPVNAGHGIEITVLSRGTLQDVKVTTNANKNHPYQNSSVKKWWRIKQTGNLSGYSLKLKYDDELLNGQNENSLEVFVSPDSGKSWKKISNPTNIVRDLINNSITVGSANYPITEPLGDIIISSGQIVLEPSISIAIGGRKEIRVGPAPNRYTISYWNNDNFATDKFFLQLNGTGGIFVRGIETKVIGTNEKVIIPIDSLVYDNKKNEVILLVQGLGPKEVRSFDIILGADPTLGKTTEPITLAAAALWIGGAIIKEYISNSIVEGCYEMWRPVSHDQSLTDATINTVSNSIEKAVTVENGVKGIAKEAAEKIIKTTVNVAVWPVTLAKDVFDCLGNTVKGMKDYVNGNFDKKSKELEKVTSWDPNAKEGPTGYGANGYLATLSPMTYAIFFENDAEKATAPAYQVEIFDTLDQNVFDINSVKFGEMSHNMGVATQTGNVLKWSFIGIELEPNKTPPQGEGWVKFTVNTKPNLPTKTEIKNRASIIFDYNKPIETDYAINVLDYDIPTTTPISAIQTSNYGVKVNWIAEDGDGSGIQKSFVYMSVDDSPFSLVAISEFDTVTVPVVPLKNYKFKVFSEDNVGNKEKENTKTVEVLTSISEDNLVVPMKYSLNQNYPNPFNPSTMIEYTLANETSVRLEIFNLLGQKVTTLVDEIQKSGSYKIRLDMKNNATGIYFYRIITKEFVETKKLMLIK